MLMKACLPLITNKPTQNYFSFLPRTFFERHTVTVAWELLGKIFLYGPWRGVITETEAYHGEDDLACHAARGRTPRTEVMYGPPGYSYVYFIYGMYHCLNVVTAPQGFPAAVLIRGIRFESPTVSHQDGPGKLCRLLNIKKETHNGLDMISNPTFGLIDAPLASHYTASPRVGISRGKEHLWRFKIQDIQ